jgi:hypothetical protein
MSVLLAYILAGTSIPSFSVFGISQTQSDTLLIFILVSILLPSVSPHLFISPHPNPLPKGEREKGLTCLSSQRGRGEDRQACFSSLCFLLPLDVIVR